MRGIFVTGTDTGIGKSFVAACLVRAWQADYWKPAQTGLAEEDGDSATIARLAEAAPARIHPPRYALQAPLSPEDAARLEGITIKLEDFTLPASPRPIVVEGAGGVLVPLGGGALMIDLMQRLGLPVLLVARGSLGTINHTLLSLEALRARRLAVRGVVMVGADEARNAAAIARLGGLPILAVLPWRAPLDAAAVRDAAGRMPPLRDLDC